MFNPAQLALAIDRGAPRVFTIQLVGIDLTGADWEGSVRLTADAAGDPLIDLPKVTEATETGIRLVETGTVSEDDATPTSWLRIQIPAMDTGTDAGDLPPAAEQGAALTLYWDFFLAPDGVTAAKLFYGPVTVNPTATKPASPYPLEDDPLIADAIMTISSGGTMLSVNAAALLAPLVAQATDAATATAEDRAAAEAAATEAGNVVGDVSGRFIDTGSGYLKAETDGAGNIAAGMKSDGTSAFAKVQIGTDAAAAGFAPTTDGGVAVVGGSFRPTSGISISTADFSGTAFDGARMVAMDPLGFVVEALLADGRKVSTENGTVPGVAKLIAQHTLPSDVSNPNTPPEEGEDFAGTAVSGFTCTGTCMAPNGLRVVANVGVATEKLNSEGDSASFAPSLVFLTPDWSKVMREILLRGISGLSGIKSIQDVTLDPTNDSYWLVDVGGHSYRNISDAEVLLGSIDPTVLDGWDGSGIVNSLEADNLTHGLWANPQGSSELYLINIDTPAIVRTITGVPTDIDEMWLNTVTRVMYCTRGENGVDGQVVPIDLTTGAVGDPITLPGSKAIEGITGDPATGIIGVVNDPALHVRLGCAPWANAAEYQLAL